MPDNNTKAMPLVPLAIDTMRSLLEAARDNTYSPSERATLIGAAHQALQICQALDPLGLALEDEP